MIGWRRVSNAMGRRNLNVNVKVRRALEDPVSYWTIAVDNRTDLAIKTDVQFAFLVVSYELAGTASSEALLIPWMGRLLNCPTPRQLQPDSPRA